MGNNSSEVVASPNFSTPLEAVKIDSTHRSRSISSGWSSAGVDVTQRQFSEHLGDQALDQTLLGRPSDQHHFIQRIDPNSRVSQSLFDRLAKSHQQRVDALFVIDCGDLTFDGAALHYDPHRDLARWHSP